MHRPIHSSLRLAFLAALVAFPGAGTGCHSEDPPEAEPSPSALSSSQGSLASRPNIIVFMLDDLDVASFAQLMSDPALLPNIRTHLVEKGVSFSESFVSNAVCCPSRVTFLTGQHSHNSGTAALGGSNGGYESFKPRQNDALAAWLQTSGYYTGHVGKYLNGYTVADPTIVPLGWDEWHALIDPSTYDMDKYKIHQRYVDGPGGGEVSGIQSYVGGLSGDSYQTDVLASRTRDIIRRWRLHGPGKPLFISVMPTAPHVEATRCWNKELNHAGQFNVEIRPKGWNPYGVESGQYGLLRARTSDGKVIDDEPRSAAFQLPSANNVAFDEADISDKPRYLRDGTVPGAGWPMLANATVCDAPHATAETLQCKDWPPQDCSMPRGKRISVIDALQRQHLGRLESVLSVDDMVGTVVGELSEELADTVFIFTSDNGYLLGEHRLVNKQQPYEESIRVPLVIRPPASSTVVRGSSQGSMVVNTDIPATILDYAGAPAGRPLDGRSLKSILQGTATVLSRRRLLVEHFFSRYVTGIAFWDVPDFSGVRTAASAGTQGAHSTYVEYYEPRAPWTPGMTWDGKITDREYYTLATDPTQLVSRHDDPSTAEERLILSEHLAALRYCRGATCTLAEDRLDFTSRTFLPVVTASSPDPEPSGFSTPAPSTTAGS